MTMKRYITLLPALLIAASAVAQTATNDTINRMVLVESTLHQEIRYCICPGGYTHHAV